MPVKPYEVIDKKGNKTTLFVDVTALKELVDAFDGLCLMNESDHIQNHAVHKKELPRSRFLVLSDFVHYCGAVVKAAIMRN